MANIQKFIDSYELYLHNFNIYDIKNFQYLDYDKLSFVTNISSDFIKLYIKYNLDDSNKIKIIEEFGMKKLIDLHCKYEGNSIYLELLYFNEYIDQWIKVLFLHLINLYP